MTDGRTDRRSRTARWVVVGAFGSIAVLMGTVAFANVVLPGQTTTYSDLPVIHIASRSVAGTASIAATKTAAASRGATLTPLPAGKGTPAVTAARTRSTGATGSSKGNTSHKESAEEGHREVVAPDLRVEDSDKHKSDHSAEH